MHGCVRHVGTDEDGGMEALVLALCLVYMLSVSEVPLVNTLVYTTCGAVHSGVQPSLIVAQHLGNVGFRCQCNTSCCSCYCRPQLCIQG
jgi:hypothetical protein